MSKPILTIEQLTLDYKTRSGNQRILDGINLTQERNEWLALIGRNGAGKTSLGLLIKGLIRPTSGLIRMYSESPEDDIRIRKSHVGYLFSNPRDQICSFTVQDDIGFGLAQIGIPRDDAKRRIIEVMKALKIMHLANKSTLYLSGSELQSVALAGLIVMKPEYLILDEPVSFLDFKAREGFLQKIKELHNNGMSILYISNSLEEIVMADRVAIISRGRISCLCTPEQLLQNEGRLNDAGFLQPDICLLGKELKRYCPSIPDHVLSIDDMIEVITNNIQ